MFRHLSFFSLLNGYYCKSISYPVYLINRQNSPTNGLSDAGGVFTDCFTWKRCTKMNVITTKAVGSNVGQYLDKGCVHNLKHHTTS